MDRDNPEPAFSADAFEISNDYSACMIVWRQTQGFQAKVQEPNRPHRMLLQAHSVTLMFNRYVIRKHQFQILIEV